MANSQILDEQMYSRIEKNFGCKWSKRPFDLEGLASGKFLPSYVNPCWSDQISSLFDHVRYWQKDRKPFAITTEPYQLDFDALDNLRYRCATHGLRIVVNGRSEWNPGGCLWIEITLNHHD